MRILHIVASRPKGGIGTFLRELVGQSSNSSHDFLISSQESDGEFDQDVVKKGSKVYIAAPLNAPFSYIKDIYRFFKNKHFEVEYDLIHVHSPIVFLFVWFVNKLSVNKKMIAHSHSIKYSDSTLGVIRNYVLYRPIRYFSDINISCSKAAGEFLFGKRSFHVIRNGIDTKLYTYSEYHRNEIREQLKSSNDFIIGQVGAFFKVKNHIFTLKMLGSIRVKSPQVFNTIKLVFIGDGPEMEHIMAKANELNLKESVVFWGRTNEPHKFYSAFDLFVMPSKFEGVPLSGVEAQTSGLNCLFSDKVSQDVNFINSKFLSIEDYEIWSEEIIKSCLKKTRNNRYDCAEIIKKKGGDSSSIVSGLETIYLESIKEY
ncbi:glycosyltransferase [Vibrio parahaemolyticus]|nr:glycosyltransferase [Vibrio parahaemolyticus]MBM5034499.1 glycosyltransferase [Vibrio parahaemolyticus]MBM5047715.1 glycosyltransferase [Vibrio parahaemolyticus]MBM5076012.1 glycosyltransferase [Vibrio parahaemolyticus]HCG8092636.1 glycosyltransferase [Vibrio parahaemolyticus]